jgi:hypothetical protein
MARKDRVDGGTREREGGSGSIEMTRGARRAAVALRQVVRLTARFAAPRMLQMPPASISVSDTRRPAGDSPGRRLSDAFPSQDAHRKPESRGAAVVCDESW